MRAGKTTLFRALVLLAFAAVSAALVKVENDPPASKPSVRVAFVIGNANYRKVGRLANPANDAADLSQALEKLNFKVFTAIDADHDQMGRQLEQFARASAGADVALFFYAGHGIQFQGKNYAVPVDADLDQIEPDEFTMSRRMLAMDDVRRALDRASGLKILILDACRNNPLSDRLAQVLAQSTRDVVQTRGLARIVTTGKGFVVAYATQPDQVAQDGGGRNSPFSAAIVRHIATRDLEIGQVFRRVTKDVLEETQGRQTPEVSLSLSDEFFLNTDKTAERPAPETRPDPPTDAAATAAPKPLLESRLYTLPADRVLSTNSISMPDKDEARSSIDTGANTHPAPAAPAEPKAGDNVLSSLDPNVIAPKPKSGGEKAVGSAEGLSAAPDGELFRKIATELVRLKCLERAAFTAEKVKGALGRYAKVASLPSAALDEATLKALQEDTDRFCPTPKLRPRIITPKAVQATKEKPVIVTTQERPTVVPEPPAPAPEPTRKRTPIHEGW